MKCSVLTIYADMNSTGVFDLFFCTGRDNDDMIRRLRSGRRVGSEGNSKIMTLDIRETVLDEDVVKEIADLLLETSVETVQLDDCGAYMNKQTSRMATALGHVKNLRLSEPTFLSHFFLDKLLASATALENLRIQDRLHGFQIKALARGLSVNRTLKSLDLSKSRIEDVDIASLAEGFAKSSTESLTLRSLNLGDDQLTQIANSLKMNPSLRKLDISFNQCRTMDCLNSLIHGSCHLRELQVGYQFVWQSPKIDISGFANVLRNDSSLTTLALPRNKLNDDDAECLGMALRDNSNLMVVDLRENKIGDDGVKTLASASLENKGLKKLYLTKNPFHLDGTNALLAMVKEKVEMVHVELSQGGHAASQIRYYSSLNHGGRCLVDKIPALDLGVWPLVIQRVNKIDWFDEHLDSHRQDVILFLLRAPPLFEVLLNRNLRE